MNQENYLIVGAHGQLGKALQLRFPKAKAVDREELDITDWDALEKFDWSSVKVIFNAAAYTNVDGAETSEGRQLAWMINATAAGYLAKIAAAHDITLVHISSEYVFDGTKSPHAEDEPLTPLGVYGQAKAAGDIAVSTASKHYILRVSWLVGDGPNFVRTIIGLAAKDISPKVVDDQVGRLTFTTTLVDGIEQLLTTDASSGTYNLSNEGQPATWAEVTEAIFENLGRNDLSVTGITTEEYYAGKAGIAPRPLQSTLNLDKIKSIGMAPADWRTELSDYIRKEQDA